MNWWELATWDGKVIWLEPDRAKAAIQLFEAGRDISLGDAGALAYKNIKSITESDKPYRSHVRALPGASKPNKTPIPGRYPNSVQATYVKKLTTEREYDRKYGGQPHHWHLEDGSTLWVVRTHIKRQDGSIPEGWVEVAKEEFDRIEARRILR